MSKVGIIGYGITPFTREDLEIESVLLKSTKNTLSKQSKYQSK